MSEIAKNSAAMAKAVKEKKPKGMILIIVFSLILIVGAIVTLITIYILWNVANGLGVEFSGILAVDQIAAIVSAVVDLIGGAVGLIFCWKASKYEIIVVSGVIMLIFALYGILMDAVNDSSLTPASIALALLFPLLYLIGGLLNRLSAKR